MPAEQVVEPARPVEIGRVAEGLVAGEAGLQQVHVRVLPPRQLRRQVHLRLRLHCFSRGAANGVLHRVSVVTKGRRFAFLPFLYDDAAARIREENARYVGETGSDYRSGTG